MRPCIGMSSCLREAPEHRARASACQPSRIGLLGRQDTGVGDYRVSAMKLAAGARSFGARAIDAILEHRREFDRVKTSGPRGEDRGKRERLAGSVAWGGHRENFHERSRSRSSGVLILSNERYAFGIASYSSSIR